MKRFYISDKNMLNEEELRTGKVSYNRIIDRYVDNLVLCNNIEKIDNSIWENIQGIDFNKEEEIEIYQYYLCNLSNFERELLEEYGIILSYSDLLDVDVLCVEHYDTSWDYVMTNVEWTENYKECEE